MSPHGPAPELHRPVSLERIGGGLEVTVEAAPEELAALAVRLGVPAVHALVCRFRLRPGTGGAVLAEGRLEARLERECVVTLEPFEAVQAEVFSLRFLPEEALADASSADEDPDAPDDVPYTGTILDLGEAAAEQLALALDPYPRSPGATLPGDAEESAPSPFAALAALRRPQ